MAEVLCCCAHEDQKYLNELRKHLIPLQKQGLISIWNDADMTPGTNWDWQINEHLNKAQIILLLVSPSFIASEYCYGIEMRRAIERHDNGEAQVIPILLRPVYWQGTPFDKLQVLPSNARPVTEWDNHDKAFLDITTGIRRVIAQEPPEILVSASAQYSSSRFTRLNLPIEKPSARKSDMSTHKRFMTGDLVNHHEFGHGKVTQRGLMGNSEFTDVQFDQHGKKRIWWL
jgi:hypothetical protein